MLLSTTATGVALHHRLVGGMASPVVPESQLCNDLMVDPACVRACMSECARERTCISVIPPTAWVRGQQVASLNPEDDLAATGVRESLFIPALVLGVLALDE